MENINFWLYVVEQNGSETLVGMYQDENELLTAMDSYPIDIELIAYTK